MKTNIELINVLFWCIRVLWYEFYFKVSYLNYLNAVLKFFITLNLIDWFVASKISNWEPL